MPNRVVRLFAGTVLLFALSSLVAYQVAVPPPNRLADPFSAGWMLSDTNGDQIIDYISGKIVVPANPSAAENAAAADLAARLGFATTGLTPPIVISAAADRSDGPRIYVGRNSVPQSRSAAVAQYLDRLAPEEGGIFALEGALVMLGKDDAGLLAAAQAYAARAPFIWRPSADSLAAIPELAAPGSQILGVTYLKGKAGVNRAFLHAGTEVPRTALENALKNTRLAAVHEVVVNPDSSPVSATAPNPLPAMPSAPAQSADAAPPADGEGAGPARLDLATLYTMRGLFRGTPRMPVPSNLDGQLFVPAGAAGIAMANLAARMGLETTGITLPLASPADTAAIRDIRTKSVVYAGTPPGKEAETRLTHEDPSEMRLNQGEGELRIVDKAFGRQPSVSGARRRCRLARRSRSSD